MSDVPLRLGGMALRNGLLVHGPTSWAAAVRAPDGSVRAVSGRKPRAPRALERIPGVGSVSLAGHRGGMRLTGEDRQCDRLVHGLLDRGGSH